MDYKISIFLEAWNNMLAAANDIEEFKYKFEVSIRSDNAFITERERMISGINKSFADNGMKYTSTSKN